MSANLVAPKEAKFEPARVSGFVVNFTGSYLREGVVDRWSLSVSSVVLPTLTYGYTGMRATELGITFRDYVDSIPVYAIPIVSQISIIFIERQTPQGDAYETWEFRNMRLRSLVFNNLEYEKSGVATHTCAFSFAHGEIKRYRTGPEGERILTYSEYFKG
jgi:hypothetical protein